MKQSSAHNPGHGRLRQLLPLDWGAPPLRAANIQRDLASKVTLCPLPEPQLVAGVDVTYSANGEYGYAVGIILRVSPPKIVETQVESGAVNYPYRPGFLAFREGPLTMAVIKKFNRRPDVILFDAAGIAHPRRCGMATQIGVLCDIPTVGCAKSPLLAFDTPVGPNKGDFSPLVVDTEVLGAALRTREAVNPVYVSPGHQSDLPSAIGLVLATITRYRLPEPIRQAHLRANILRAEHKN